MACICRDAQIATLRHLLGVRGPNDIPAAATFVYGGPNTGKTLLVQHGLAQLHAARTTPALKKIDFSISQALTMTTVLAELGVVHALVSCVECHSPRILFETILNRLAGVVPSSSNGYQSYTRCDK